MRKGRYLIAAVAILTLAFAEACLAAGTAKDEDKSRVVLLTGKNFETEVLSSKLPVLVDFYADWCGPCRMMGPVIEQVAKDKVAVLKVGKLNVDENKELARKYNIRGIPALLIFKDGKEAGRIIGYRDRESLLKEIAPYLQKK